MARYQNKDFILSESGKGFIVERRVESHSRYGVFYGWRQVGRVHKDLKGAQRKLAKLMGTNMHVIKYLMRGA